VNPLDTLLKLLHQADLSAKDSALNVEIKCDDDNITKYAHSVLVAAPALLDVAIQAGDVLEYYDTQDDVPYCVTKLSEAMDELDGYDA